MISSAVRSAVRSAYNETTDDLQEMISSSVRSAVRSALNETKEESPKYCTRKELCSIFKVSMPTIHNWINKGLLLPHKIGSRTYFDFSEVQQAMKTRGVYKYKHK